MQQLDPKAVWLFFFTTVMGWFWTVLVITFYVFPFIMESVFQDDALYFGGVITTLVAITIVVSLFSYIWAKLSYSNYKYELTDAGFRKEHGVIMKRYVTVPYDRIQNVDILRGLIARIFGLSDLHIQTAGMSGAAGSEGRLPGVSPEMAEQLRDELILRARRISTPQPAAPTPAAPPQGV